MVDENKMKCNISNKDIVKKIDESLIQCIFVIVRISFKTYGTKNVLVSKQFKFCAASLD